MAAGDTLVRCLQAGVSHIAANCGPKRFGCNTEILDCAAVVSIPVCGQNTYTFQEGVGQTYCDDLEQVSDGLQQQPAYFPWLKAYHKLNVTVQNKNAVDRL